MLTYSFCVLFFSSKRILVTEGWDGKDSGVYDLKYMTLDTQSLVVEGYSKVNIIQVVHSPSGKCHYLSYVFDGTTLSLSNGIRVLCGDYPLTTVSVILRITRISVKTWLTWSVCRSCLIYSFTFITETVSSVQNLFLWVRPILNSS